MVAAIKDEFNLFNALPNNHSKQGCIKATSLFIGLVGYSKN